MRIEFATAEHKRAFSEWRKLDRLEEHTCRPVIDGKRIPRSDESITLAFLVDGSHEPVGQFTYFDVNPRSQSAEFGYTVNPKIRNRGVGANMLRAAINHLFLATELNKLYCQTGAFNIASVKLLEKIGLHRDGTLREHHELDGRLWDDYVYSILRREWEKSELFKRFRNEVK